MRTERERGREREGGRGGEGRGGEGRGGEGRGGEGRGGGGGKRERAEYFWVYSTQTGRLTISRFIGYSTIIIYTTAGTHTHTCNNVLRLTYLLRCVDHIGHGSTTAHGVCASFQITGRRRGRGL